MMTVKNLDMLVPPVACSASSIPMRRRASRYDTPAIEAP